eukprot:s427_g13.t1
MVHRVSKQYRRKQETTNPECRGRCRRSKARRAMGNGRHADVWQARTLEKHCSSNEGRGVKQSSGGVTQSGRRL